MQTYAMTLCLRDAEGVVERYRKEHRQAWPEVVELLQACGFRSLRLYLRGRRLCMVLEADDGVDVPAALAALDAEPAYRSWDELMRSLQEPAPEAGPGDWWAPMELVFDLDWFDGAARPA